MLIISVKDNENDRWKRNAKNKTKTEKNKKDTRISLPLRTNGKPLAAIGEFSIVIGKLMIGKTLATSGEEITNAMFGNDVLAIYW